MTDFVPPVFQAPRELVTEHCVLRPLGPQHNESDYEAWTTSVEHIRSSPGYGPDSTWPDPGMSLEQNLEDLEMHARHFAADEGFTYTVLDRADEARVVGCLYVYPSDRPGVEAHVRSWVRADRADLDGEVRSAVASWLARDWPFRQVEYAGAPEVPGLRTART
jgi:hypothetical protein